MSEVITETKTASGGKELLLFVLTLIGGFVLFILPNLLLGISKWNGGLSGINLLYIALFQCISVCTLIYFSLKHMGKDFRFIGLSSNYWKADTVLGLLTGLSWTALQFIWIIPSTGGTTRNDIIQMLDTMDGTLIGLLSYIALGVIGGGITEEIFNRGYFINVLKSTFNNQKLGLWIAGILSILFFAAGHLPSNTIEWFDILVPTLAYTLLFIYTRRLTASIVAHAVYNATAVLSVYYLYYP